MCTISVQTGSSWAVTGASDSCSTRSPSAAPVLWPFPWCLKGEFAPCGWLGSRKAFGYYSATGTISKSVWDKSDLKDCQKICRVIIYLSVNKQVSSLSRSQAVSLSKVPPGPKSENASITMNNGSSCQPVLLLTGSFSLHSSW